MIHFHSLFIGAKMMSSIYLTGVLCVILRPQGQHNSSLAKTLPDKPIMLLWFWPEHFRFDLSDRATLFNIDSCLLTDGRSMYNKADGVLIFHKSIKRDLSNLPRSPRPPFQKWIWFHKSLLTARKGHGEDFVLPKKDKLVCWIVKNNNPVTGSGQRYNYYRELVKHIKVEVFGKAFGRFLNYEDYYDTISSCKFYLSFENSVHRDYITETLNRPLAAGTVPVVLSPPRQNYEDFVSGDSIIHVNDFPYAKALAEFLLKLDEDDEAYLHYFQWREHFSAQCHLIQQYQEFTQTICYACDHVGTHGVQSCSQSLQMAFWLIRHLQ
uniref:Fucosyltransferase n=1 Tax=Hucho hucho TaxID=62062 RepID=A0A4W5M6B8_9TELE